MSAGNSLIFSKQRPLKFSSILISEQKISAKNFLRTKSPKCHCKTLMFESFPNFILNILIKVSRKTYQTYSAKHISPSDLFFYFVILRSRVDLSDLLLEYFFLFFSFLNSDFRLKNDKKPFVI